MREQMKAVKESMTLTMNKEIDMKEQIKKATNVSSKATVSATVGGGSKCFSLSGKALCWLGNKSLAVSSYLDTKKDSMHAWIDETIEIGKTLEKEQQSK